MKNPCFGVNNECDVRFIALVLFIKFNDVTWHRVRQPNSTRIWFDTQMSLDLSWFNIFKWVDFRSG